MLKRPKIKKYDPGFTKNTNLKHIEQLLKRKIYKTYKSRNENTCTLTSSFKLLTSNTVLRCWPGRRNPATPRAAAVVAAGDKAKLPRGKANKITGKLDKFIKNELKLHNRTKADMGRDQDAPRPPPDQSTS